MTVAFPSSPLLRADVRNSGRDLRGRGLSSSSVAIGTKFNFTAVVLIRAPSSLSPASEIHAQQQATLWRVASPRFSRELLAGLQRGAIQLLLATAGPALSSLSAENITVAMDATSHPTLMDAAALGSSHGGPNDAIPSNTVVAGSPTVVIGANSDAAVNRALGVSLGVLLPAVAFLAYLVVKRRGIAGLQKGKLLKLLPHQREEEPILIARLAGSAAAVDNAGEGCSAVDSGHRTRGRLDGVGGYANDRRAAIRTNSPHRSRGSQRSRSAPDRDLSPVGSQRSQRALSGPTPRQSYGTGGSVLQDSNQMPTSTVARGVGDREGEEPYDSYGSIEDQTQEANAYREGCCNSDVTVEVNNNSCSQSPPCPDGRTDTARQTPLPTDGASPRKCTQTYPDQTLHFDSDDACDNKPDSGQSIEEGADDIIDVNVQHTGAGARDQKNDIYDSSFACADWPASPETFQAAASQRPPCRGANVSASGTLSPSVADASSGPRGSRPPAASSNSIGSPREPPSAPSRSIATTVGRGDTACSISARDSGRALIHEMTALTHSDNGIGSQSRLNGRKQQPLQLLPLKNSTPQPVRLAPGTVRQPVQQQQSSSEHSFTCLWPAHASPGRLVETTAVAAGTTSAVALIAPSSTGKRGCSTCKRGGSVASPLTLSFALTRAYETTTSRRTANAEPTPGFVSPAASSESPATSARIPAKQVAAAPAAPATDATKPVSLTVVNDELTRRSGMNGSGCGNSNDSPMILLELPPRLTRELQSPPGTKSAAASASAKKGKQQRKRAVPIISEDRRISNV